MVKPQQQSNKNRQNQGRAPNINNQQAFRRAEQPRPAGPAAPPVATTSKPVEAASTAPVQDEGAVDGEGDEASSEGAADTQAAAPAVGAAVAATPARRPGAQKRPPVDLKHMHTQMSIVAARMRMFIAGTPASSIHIHDNALWFRDDQRSTEDRRVEYGLVSWSVEDGYVRMVASVNGRNKALANNATVDQIKNLTYSALEDAMLKCHTMRDSGALLDLEEGLTMSVWPGAGAEAIAEDHRFIRPYVEDNALRIEITIPSDRAIAIGARKLANQVSGLLTLIRSEG